MPEREPVAELPPLVPAPIDGAAGLAVGPASAAIEREADASARRAVEALDGVDHLRPRVVRTVGVSAASDRIGPEGGAARPEDAGVLQRLRQAGGSPMESATRQAMETAMGHRFDRVRIHTGDTARQLSHRFGAEAFTVGRDVVFRNGFPDVSTRQGRFILAHELSHIVQVPTAIARVHETAGPETPGPAARHETDDALARDLPAVPVPQAGGPVVLWSARSNGRGDIMFCLKLGTGLAARHPGLTVALVTDNRSLATTLGKPFPRVKVYDFKGYHGDGQPAPALIIEAPTPSMRTAENMLRCLLGLKAEEELPQAPRPPVVQISEYDYAPAGPSFDKEKIRTRSGLGDGSLGV